MPRTREARPGGQSRKWSGVCIRHKQGHREEELDAQVPSLGITSIQLEPKAL